MPETRLIDGMMGQCPLCLHPPIRHVEDGTGATCLICAWLAEQDRKNYKLPRHVCTVKFNFKLSKHEREQAERADKASYPPRTVCAECYCYWEAHSGYLCPTGDSTFLPLLDKDLPFIYVK